MPGKSERVSALLGLIDKDEFRGDRIDLANEGLTDSHVIELMAVINSNHRLKKSLKYIDFQNNWLTVPPDISGCVSLQYLYLHDNCLTVPPDIQHCKKLKGLGLIHNPLTEIGQKALYAFQRSNLSIGWHWNDIGLNELTKTAFDQHLRSMLDIYIEQYADKIVKADVRKEILGLATKIFEVLDIIFSKYPLSAKEHNYFKQVYSGLADSIEGLINRCHYSIYQKAQDTEVSDLQQAKLLYLEAAKAGSEAAVRKIQDYMKSAAPQILSIIRCPISLDIIIYPVTSPSGHTYEMSAITKWIQRSDQFLDHTRQPLDIPIGSGQASLVPNKTLTELVEYMLMNDCDIGEYPGFVNPHTGNLFTLANLNLEGITVEADPTNDSLRPDYVVNQLLSYVHAHKKNSRLRLTKF